MAEAGLDKHQLAGVDSRERGFSRPVEFERAGDQYRAILRYESVRITTDPHPTADHALVTLIQVLHSQGYRQLRTQKSFQNGVYLGSQELWIEYPDPQPEQKTHGIFTLIAGWFRSRGSHKEQP